MFETYVVSEIIKSFSNEGIDYRFCIFYYRGKDKSSSGENEIDQIIEENGILYPVEIKMTGNPKASMGSTNPEDCCSCDSPFLDRFGLKSTIMVRIWYIKENHQSAPL